MVVCGGIERAIQYCHAIREYLQERKSRYQAGGLDADMQDAPRKAAGRQEVARLAKRSTTKAAPYAVLWFWYV